MAIKLLIYPFKPILTICLLLASGLQAIGVSAADKPVDVIIVGAGLSGLSAGYYLKKAGKTVQILEMSPHIGGRIRTAAYAENAFAEVGLEEFWGNNPALDIFRELNIPLESNYGGFSSFYHQGKLYANIYDSKLEFLQSVLSVNEIKAYQQWDTKMLALFNKLELRSLSAELLALKDVAFADWLSETSGLSVKTQEMIRIQTEPEYGGSWQQISALDAIAEWHFFSGEGQVPYHVPGGNQIAAEAIADSIGKTNILLNQQVSNVKSDADGVEVSTMDTASFHQQRYHAKYVITAIPLYRLNDIQFTPPLTPERKQAIQTQLGGAYFTAHVLLDGKARQFWSLDGKSLLPILTDSELGVIYEGKATGDNLAVLNLLVTGLNAEKFNLRVGAVDDVRATLLAAFEKQWPGFGAMVKQMIFYRYHPRAIAAWPVGRSRFDSLSDSLRQPQGRVYFAGDFTEDTHSNGAAVSALRVVKDILQKDY